MKNMLNKLIITVAFLLFADGVFAQIGIGFGTGGFGMGMNIPINKKKSQRNNRMESQVQQLKNDLDLNDDQVIKVRGLLIERDRARQRGDRDTMSNEDFDKRMQEILTSEQYAKYTDLKQQKREERKEGMKEKNKEKEKEKEKEKLPESDWDDVYR
jgi:periplasmic protein CpxP/Spy